MNARRENLRFRHQLSASTTSMLTLAWISGGDMGNIEEAIRDGENNAGNEGNGAVLARFMDELRRNVPIPKISRSEDIKELQHYLSVINSEIEFARSKSADPAFYRRVMPHLLRRKELIASRLWELTNTRQINSLREAVDLISEPGDREKIRAELDALEKSSKSYATESQESIAEQYEWEKSTALLKQHISERKWNVRAQLLARESVATLVGSLLLVGLASVITVAMFMKLQVSEILANSFLIVLGYFFGQNNEKRRASSES